MKKDKIKGEIIGKSIISDSKEAKDLYSRNRIGEIVKGKVSYSLVEAMYLLERKRLELKDKGKKITFDVLMRKTCKKSNNFFSRYHVYSDLRERGYIVKTALKFGADFRVYEKGVKPGENHALWIVYPVHETDILTWHEFSAKNRVAHSTNKKLLIGIVDEEAQVTYYEVEWKKP